MQLARLVSPEQGDFVRLYIALLSAQDGSLPRLLSNAEIAILCGYPEVAKAHPPPTCNELAELWPVELAEFTAQGLSNLV